MPEFKLFDYIDTALVQQESRTARTSLVPAVWPSEASATRIDKSVGNIVGKCMRASYLRLIGWPITNQIDAVGGWRFLTGRLMEGTLVDLARGSKPMVYVANGVRAFIEEFYMPLELDLVVRNPEDNRGWIAECKTYYGYMAAKDIKGGKPKLDNLMQIMLYLQEIRTGARLKELIAKGLAERASGTGHVRNRIEAAEEAVKLMDDGPLGAKLVYIARDDCARTEFTVTVEEDFDGSHYPAVDGQIDKTFTVESIYERYRTLQNHWLLARREGVRRLADKGVDPPAGLELVLNHGDKSVVPAEYPKDYLDALADEVRRLPDEFLPPAEYQWAYSPEKIELLFTKNLIGKTRYNDWKKKKAGKDRIGDWQCLYCPFKRMCVPKQNPNWAYQLYDIDQMEADEDTVAA